MPIVNRVADLQPDIQAWRRNISGVVKAPFPVFWGVQKA